MANLPYSGASLLNSGYLVVFTGFTVRVSFATGDFTAIHIDCGFSCPKLDYCGQFN